MLVLEGRFKDRLSQNGFHMEHRLADIAEAVLMARWYNHGVPCRESRAVLIHPDFCLPIEDRENLFDRVQVGRAPTAGVTPLLKDTELN